MGKPNPSSVTEIPCQCGYLENAANEPDGPIRFDDLTGEYEFLYDEGTRSPLRRIFSAISFSHPQQCALVIYHCPFCGGAAPPSRRHLLFAKISNTEKTRLKRLLENIHCVDDAIETFGNPDFDGHCETRTSGLDGKPPTVKPQRDIRWHGLSENAEVWITEGQDGRICWTLVGKYIGPRENNNDGERQN